MEYSSGFIGDFKVGDNIVHNLAILREFYAVQSRGGDAAHLFRKPIIIFIGAVAEAILYDLFTIKIKQFTKEGVPNIDDGISNDFSSKKIDEFSKYISYAKNNQLLGADLKLYDDLEELRKLRNRIHIQNKNLILKKIVRKEQNKRLSF